MAFSSLIPTLSLRTLLLCFQGLLQFHRVEVVLATIVPLRVHKWPGGGTLASPFYAVDVEGEGSFVWYTSAANRQPIAAGNNVPQTSVNKDTSFTMFDMSSPHLPTHVDVSLLEWTAQSVEIRPSSANIQATLAPSGKGFAFTLTEPRQVCAVVNGNRDKPLCIFADPAQEAPPIGPTDNVIFFGPGVHHPGQINVTAGQIVYLAGGAHVYGQVVAPLGVQCDFVQVIGRGVLDGHSITIDYRAKAMIELPSCHSILIEGITTIDSPQYQSNAFAPGGTIRFAKSIAWGFTTDGFGSGEYSTVEHCFFKVNDDSSKLYFTGMVVQHNVYWQMENGCPLMMSWNTADNVGFVTARDNDVIAHEKVRHDSDVDGIVCAYHGGQGSFNNYIIDGLRIENAQWAFVSVYLSHNPWSPQALPIGNISTIILRNVTAALPFKAPPPDAYHIWGETSRSRVDTFVFDNVKIAGKPFLQEDIAPGIGKFATNVTVCSECAARMFPSLGGGRTVWTRDERCGRTPQPFCDGTRLPPLSDFVGQSPLCEETWSQKLTQLWAAGQVTQLPTNTRDPKLNLILKRSPIALRPKKLAGGFLSSEQPPQKNTEM